MYTTEALGKALEDLTAAYNNFVKNAKDAAIEAMGATVIAQIKQEAKDHIAAELTAQKTALEKAIADAKTAINNSSSQAHTALQQAAATAISDLTSNAEAKKLKLTSLIQEAELALNEKVNESKSYIDAQLSAASAGVDESIKTKVSEMFNGEEERLLKKVDEKFIEHYKKGYLQLPGMPSPLEDTSMHYAGYSWHEVNLDGNFFRAKGRDAKSFSAKKLTTEQIKNGSYIFQDDEQGDASRQIKGDMGGMIRFRASGPFDYSKIDYMLNQGSYFGMGNYDFDSSRVVPTANENRPRNLTVVYWVLVKNE